MNKPDEIVLCDLKAQYQQIKDEVGSAIMSVIESTAFIKGPAVREFEGNFATTHGLTQNCAVGCSNGTSALTVILEAMALGEGAEVILPSHTFFATAESILRAGYQPVFADVVPEDYTIDPASVERLITPKTRAIVPVHIYGSAAHMDGLKSLASQHNLKIVEDTAQAHLAEWDGAMTGSIGDAASYSFYPGKNLGAYGDAGMCLVSDAALADKVRKLVDHGRYDKYLHDLVGDNQRIDTVQAAVLGVKLKYLPAWTDQRRRAARYYDSQFKPNGFKVIDTPPESNPVYHLYIAEVSNRDEVIAHLRHNNIHCGIHYPVPVHRQPALLDKGFRCDDLAVTDRIVDRIISLPIFPEITDEQLDKVSSTFLEVAQP